MAVGTIKNRKWTKVWENQNPNADFPETTISLDLSAYSELLFLFSRNKSEPSGYNFSPPNYINFRDAPNAAVHCNGIVDAAGRLGRRIVSDISTTGFRIGDASKYNSYGGNGIGDNSVLIPVFVYAR